MALDQITSQSIAPNAITVEDISNGSITAAKLHDTAIADKLGYTPVSPTQLNNLIDSAPTALDTLNELAAALNDDANFASTVTTALSTKANTSSLGTLASVSPTGTPDSTKFLRGDNSWQVVAVTPTAVSDQNNTSTGYFDLPSGSDAQRPGSPAVGMIRYSTTTGAGEIYTSLGWAAFGAALGTEYNAYVSVAQAQSNAATTGLQWFKNSSGTAKQVYYDATDGGWILLASNNANDATIPSGQSRHDLTYTLHRNGNATSLGTPSPNSDYIIGNWYSAFQFTRVRILGWGKGSTNNTYSFPSNLGEYLNLQWNSTSKDDVIGRGSVSSTGNSSLDANASYFVLDAIYKDYVNGGFSANADQTTIGAAGVAGSSGDPTTGCYVGHGSGGEPNGEGWYPGPSNAQGYTTWVR